jgi:uncharacterized protein YcbK (DUF882 family)
LTSGRFCGFYCAFFKRSPNWLSNQEFKGTRFFREELGSLTALRFSAMLFLDDMKTARGAKLNRRSFLGFALSSALMCLSPSRAWSALGDIQMPKRSLSLYNPNTKEAVNTTYWADGDYVSQALAEINHIMRDRLTGQTKPIDTNLLDLLFAIGTRLEIKHPLHIISGYRSPETNELLRKRGKPAAKNSYHLRGKAADIRVPGYRPSVLRRVSAQLRGGGVGYYPRSRFLHVDVGPVRFWSGR